MVVESLLLRSVAPQEGLSHTDCPRSKHSVYTKYVDNGPELQHSCYRAQNVRHHSAEQFHLLRRPRGGFLAPRQRGFPGRAGLRGEPGDPDEVRTLSASGTLTS
jgi:hypothetical protein